MIGDKVLVLQQSLVSIQWHALNELHFMAIIVNYLFKMYAFCHILCCLLCVMPKNTPYSSQISHSLLWLIALLLLNA